MAKVIDVYQDGTPKVVEISSVKELDNSDYKNVEIIVVNDFKDYSFKLNLDISIFDTTPKFKNLKEIQLTSLHFDLDIDAADEQNIPIIRLLSDGVSEDFEIKHLYFDTYGFKKIYFNDRRITLNEVVEYGDCDELDDTEDIPCQNPLVLYLNGKTVYFNKFFDNQNIKKVLLSGNKLESIDVYDFKKRKDLLIEKDGNLYVPSADGEYEYIYSFKDPNNYIDSLKENTLILSGALKTEKPVIFDARKYDKHGLSLGNHVWSNTYQARLGKGSHLYISEDCNAVHCSDVNVLDNINIHFPSKECMARILKNVKIKKNVGLYICEEKISFEEEDLKNFKSLTVFNLSFYNGKTLNIPDNIKKIEDKAFSKTKIEKIVLPNSEIDISYGAFENSNLVPNIIDNGLYFSSYEDEKYLLVGVEKDYPIIKILGAKKIFESAFKSLKNCKILDLSECMITNIDLNLFKDTSIKVVILPYEMITLAGKSEQIEAIYVKAGKWKDALRSTLVDLKIYYSDSFSKYPVVYDRQWYETQEDYVFNFHRGSVASHCDEIFLKDENSNIISNIDIDSFMKQMKDKYLN